MMRIALLYPYWHLDLPPKRLTSSIDIIGVRLAENLAAQRHDVTLYIRGGRRGGPRSTHDGITYVPLSSFGDNSVVAAKATLKRATGIDVERVLGHRGPSYNCHFYASQAGKAIQRDGADIIHVLICESMIPIVSRYNPQAKIALHMQDHSQVQRNANVVERALRHTDLIVGCSDFIANNVSRTYPQFAQRCLSIPNAVDCDQFQPRPEAEPVRNDALKLLYVARVSPEKGVATLVEAFGRVREAGVNAELTILGPSTPAALEYVDPEAEDGLLQLWRPYFDANADFLGFLRNLIPEQCRSSVRFPGAVSHDTIRDSYKAADIFIAPSVWPEPFGIPVIEAMACGLPVIATDYGAFPEIVADGRTGLLVERGDPDVLARAILQLCGDPGLRAEMGSAGRVRAREIFDWKAVAGRWIDAYGSVLT